MRSDPKRAPADRSRSPPKRKGAGHPEQFERFVEAAPELGVDESGEAFERALEKIAPSRSGATQKS
jgi:hypothetical protein